MLFVPVLVIINDVLAGIAENLEAISEGQYMLAGGYMAAAGITAVQEYRCVTDRTGRQGSHPSRPRRRDRLGSGPRRPRRTNRLGSSRSH